MILQLSIFDEVPVTNTVATKLNNKPIAKSRKVLHAPYTHEAFVTYFAVIDELGIRDTCIEPDPINEGGTRDTAKGAALYRVIYDALMKLQERKKNERKIYA